MVRARGEAKRQRRLLLRLATSTHTLLSLKLGLGVNPDIRHTFPIPPSLTVKILKLLAEGRSIEEALQLEEGGNEETCRAEKMEDI